MPLIVRGKQGYVMVVLLIAVVILGVFLMMARPLWQTELQRDLEEEYLFRARSIAQGIERYVKKHNNLFPQSLKVLAEEKMVRRLYTDPLTEHGRWYVVMQQRGPAASGYLLVEEEMAPRYIANAVIVGVCSTSEQKSFREYRGRTIYNEWAVVIGEKEDQPLPQLDYPARK